MNILGIGNAIVDVICKVDDDFLAKNNLAKSNMKLIDETEFKKLLVNLKIEETVSGGSVANSIVGLSQLDNKVGFIGKVNDDELGQKYEQGLKKEKVRICELVQEDIISVILRHFVSRCFVIRSDSEILRSGNEKGYIMSS